MEGPTIMNELRIKNNWDEVKKKLKEKYAVLTDKDLTYEEGKEEKLIHTLQEKLGKSKDEVQELLQDLSS
jgi:uncharacterized protein YjbJ (UPF0337 family)